MIMYRVDVLDLAELPVGFERWKPDSYWDSREEAEDFVALVEDQGMDAGKLYRCVEVVGEVIF